MEASSNGPERNQFFQKVRIPVSTCTKIYLIGSQLKPFCVKISQLAIRESSDGAAANARELGDLTSHVVAILEEQIQLNPLVLDEKLAEYVFFPLFHIFRQIDRYPMSLIENCIKCLTILITHGWKSRISSQLVQQLLSLLTFIIDRDPGSQEKRLIPEETVLETLKGLKALFNAAGSSVLAASGLADTDAIPALGHGITVMLNEAADGASPQIQYESLDALQAVYKAIREHAALASFLPGTLSSLTKILSTSARYKKAVISKSLDTVAVVLTRVLSDLRTRPILVEAERGGPYDSDSGALLTPAWLKATASQVKRALSTVVKLRNHDSPEITESLRKLCVRLLDECHKTLSDCKAMLVETAMVLDDADHQRNLMETTLRDIVSIYPELTETVKTTVYNWMTSLPRIVQGGDEEAKRIALRNLSKGVGFIKELRIESATLDDSMSSTLRDSIASLILSTKVQGAIVHTDIQLADQTMMLAQDYQPVILTHESQRRLRSEISSLLNFIGSNTNQASLAAKMLEHAQDTNPINQIAAYWLCFQLLKASDASPNEIDTFFDLSSFPSTLEDSEMVLNELYAFSVQTLVDHGDVESIDWRVEAIALEVAAYTARKLGESFRPELIDVLFPICTFLGSPNVKLREHAVVTLNSIAASCGYESVSELIIDNVDYMVNSVALRLNTLDISPASVNVLKMMIRLAGPRLVPYLDDVVDSIFTTLDNYHGYPVLVESLFEVLKEIVDQGSRSDMLLLENQKTCSVDHKKRAEKSQYLARLLEDLARIRERKRRESDSHESGHPEVPWKSKDAQDTNPSNAGGDEEKPPNTSTYQLLLRVANLTQHYLTSPTPTLRRSLLGLLQTASVALAADEEAFLPLVNAIWPVVIGRIRDPEAYITIEACHAVAGLCSTAGDFLSSRFKTEWHEWLRDWCCKAKRQASITPANFRPHGERSYAVGPANNGSHQLLIPIRTEDGLSGKTASIEQAGSHTGSLGQHGSPIRIWESAVNLLTAIVLHVRIDDDMFDDILGLLSDKLDQNDEVREALEAINGDAVWLMQFEQGRLELPQTPHLDGVEFVEMSVFRPREPLSS